MFIWSNLAHLSSCETVLYLIHFYEKVYSLVQNVVRIQLIESKKLFERDLSEDIIKIGLMESCDESEDSKVIILLFFRNLYE